MSLENRQKLVVRLVGAALVAAVATFHSPALSAQARATVQVSVTIVPAVQPMPLVQEAARLVTADPARIQSVNSEALGGLAQVRTAVQPPRDQATARRATVTIEYAAN